MKKIELYCLFISIFLVTLFIPNVHAQDPEVWVEAPPIFTIAKTESINIYVKNTGTSEEDYDITYDINSVDGRHLINVYLPIDKTKTIKNGDVGSVLARITLLGPIPQPATISFTATTDGTSGTSEDIPLISASPINLPEFGLIGLIMLLILASLLVISNSSHFR